jgi:SMODS and SLOG-associating 2TM effector domain 1
VRGDIAASLIEAHADLKPPVTHWVPRASCQGPKPTIVAHIEASRYQHPVTSYLAAAARLEDLDTDFDAARTNAGTWSEFVNGCEEVIAAENNSWVAKWTKATTT